MSTRDTDNYARAITELGLSMDVVFVPWSQSRNYKDMASINVRSLNWRISILYNGRPVLTTDYSAGIAHCPAYKAGSRTTLDYVDAITAETERGRVVARNNSLGLGFGAPITPVLSDVFASLTLDATVLDYRSFEDWAADYGYDIDSRNAEKLYRECLKTALALRSAIGDGGLAALQQLFQDY